MSWKKVPSVSNARYKCSGYDHQTVYADDVTLDMLNNPEIESCFERNPNFITFSTRSINKDLLPAGIYRLETDYAFSDAEIEEITPVVDKTLIEIDAVKEVIKDFKHFEESTEIRKKLGLLKKSGVLLYGPPGTGKTSCIQLIINKIRPIDSLVIYASYILPFSFIRELKQDPRLKIIIFEEITTIVDKGDTSQLLTFLDGEDSADNMYIIATTNYPEKLPGNIINRKGRFNKVIKIGNASAEDRNKYMTHLLGREPSKKEIKVTESLPMASIKEIVLLHLVENISIEKAIQTIKDHDTLVNSSFGETISITGFN